MPRAAGDPVFREDLARGTLRFTLGADNTPEEMEELVKQLKLAC